MRCHRRFRHRSFGTGHHGFGPRRHGFGSQHHGFGVGFGPGFKHCGVGPKCFPPGPFGPHGFKPGHLGFGPFHYGPHGLGSRHGGHHGHGHRHWRRHGPFNCRPLDINNPFDANNWNFEEFCECDELLRKEEIVSIINALAVRTPPAASPQPTASPAQAEVIVSADNQNTQGKANGN